MATVLVPITPPADLVHRDSGEPQAVQNGRPALAGIVGSLEAACAYLAAAARPALSSCAPRATVDSTATTYTMRHWLPHYAATAVVRLGFASEEEVTVDIDISTGYGGSESATVTIPSSWGTSWVWECEIEIGAGTAAISESTLVVELDRTAGGEQTVLLWISMAIRPAGPEVTA